MIKFKHLLSLGDEDEFKDFIITCIDKDGKEFCISIIDNKIFITPSNIRKRLDDVLYKSFVSKVNKLNKAIKQLEFDINKFND